MGGSLVDGECVWGGGGGVSAAATAARSCCALRARGACLACLGRLVFRLQARQLLQLMGRDCVVKAQLTAVNASTGADAADGPRGLKQAELEAIDRDELISLIQASKEMHSE